MKIVFMGTPDFAVPTLKALYEYGHEICAVFTQPDKAVGRKQVITFPPVKDYALSVGLNVYQPDSLKNADVTDLIASFSPDVIVVVAYGKILPEAVLNIPKFGSVNGHASLLPRHRGASPIQWSIVCGDKITGVTTMLMEKGLDTGDMLLRSSLEIGDDETGEQLHDRLSLLTAKLMLDTLQGLSKGEITPQKQDDSASTYAPIISREMGHIDFNEPSFKIHNLIRGFYSWPAAYFILDSKRIKVLASKIGTKSEKSVGTLFEKNGELHVVCGDGITVRLCEIQPEGSKRMSDTDYLKGHAVKENTVITRE